VPGPDYSSAQRPGFPLQNNTDPRFTTYATLIDTISLRSPRIGSILERSALIDIGPRGVIIAIDPQGFEANLLREPETRAHLSDTARKLLGDDAAFTINDLKPGTTFATITRMINNATRAIRQDVEDSVKNHPLVAAVVQHLGGVRPALRNAVARQFRAPAGPIADPSAIVPPTSPKRRFTMKTMVLSTCLAAALALVACGDSGSDTTGSGGGGTGGSADGGNTTTDGGGGSAPAGLNGCSDTNYQDRTDAAADHEITWDLSVGSSDERCLEIKAGQSVKFVGNFTTHPLQEKGGDTPNPIADADLSGADTTVTFDTAGEFGFVCGVHASMTGAIKVVP
jgi:plastocyanin